jgi:hypothetical protein
MAKSLIAAPEAWASPRQKLKHPGEWIVAALRATGVNPPDIRPVMQAQNMLGEPLWRPPAPNGFADDDGTWLDGLAQRLDVANQFARMFGGEVDEGCFEEVLAPSRPPKRARPSHAENRPQALALLLMAPEFQRSDHVAHAPPAELLLLPHLLARAYLPKVARAEGRDPRLLVIILRGALDGLAAAAPVGDPDWVRLRGDKALTREGAAPGLPLDAMFALNPAMPNLHRLFGAGSAMIVHACATGYRERSHFDGQDVLESGLAKPGAVSTGWSTAHSPRSNPRAAPIRRRAMRLRSGRLLRSSCAGPRRCYHGRRRGCLRPAMTR